ncbi:hypothetical protein Raf01_96480 [Rugosimonospora africana]|uniref:Helix-turn-helix domain-containing protein n=1 Tax=Rugosimonospora africana TaxID=556532 RepID=A0A8J3VX38_9ACTN|nr:hypothetical protein Raf01_96480 [Rugosimonospora africana]
MGRSWLSAALNGPLCASLSMPCPHLVSDSPSARKALTVETKALYRVSEAMRLLSMSRTVIYEQLRSGRLRSVHQGRARLIPASAITDYVALLERESLGRAA